MGSSSIWVLYQRLLSGEKRGCGGHQRQQHWEPGHLQLRTAFGGRCTARAQHGHSGVSGQGCCSSKRTGTCTNLMAVEARATRSFPPSLNSHRCHRKQGYSERPEVVVLLRMPQHKPSVPTAPIRATHPHPRRGPSVRQDEDFSRPGRCHCAEPLRAAGCGRMRCCGERGAAQPAPAPARSCFRGSEMQPGHAVHHQSMLFFQSQTGWPAGAAVAGSIAVLSSSPTPPGG